jgi:hypothetical protein
MSRQAYGILRKVDEVDDLLSKDPRLMRRMIEVHPEVSFAEWKGGRALSYAKRKAKGRKERCNHIAKIWPGEIERLRERLPRSKYAVDDLHDAFAALWTMRRYVKNAARVLGDDRVDSKGLPMRIVAWQTREMRPSNPDIPDLTPPLQPALLPGESIGIDAVVCAQFADGLGQVIAHGTGGQA